MMHDQPPGSTTGPPGAGSMQVHARALAPECHYRPAGCRLHAGCTRLGWQLPLHSLCIPNSKTLPAPATRTCPCPTARSAARRPRQQRCSSAAPPAAQVGAPARGALQTGSAIGIVLECSLLEKRLGG